MRRATTEPAPVRALLIGVAALWLLLIIFLPLIAVFTQAFAKGLGYFAAALAEPDAWASIKLTLLTAAIVVPFCAKRGRSAGSTIWACSIRQRRSPL